MNVKDFIYSSFPLSMFFYSSKIPWQKTPVALKTLEQEKFVEFSIIIGFDHIKKPFCRSTIGSESKFLVFFSSSVKKNSPVAYVSVFDWNISLKMTVTIRYHRSMCIESFGWNWISNFHFRRENHWKNFEIDLKWMIDTIDVHQAKLIYS